MNLVVQLAAVVAVLGLIAAAFTYFFNPRQAEGFLKKTGITILALLLVPVLLAQLFGEANSLQVLVGFIVLSIAAFIIRENLRPRKPIPQKSGHTERTPVLPYREDQ